MFEESPVRYLSKKPSHCIFGDSVMSGLRHSLAGLPMGIVIIMQPAQNIPRVRIFSNYKYF